MLYISNDLIKYSEYKYNVKYITDEEKKEVFKKLDNIKTINIDENINTALNIIIQSFDNDYISQDIFKKYSQKELDTILDIAENILLSTLNPDDSINKDSELYKRYNVSKITNIIQGTKSKEIRNLPISALFF